MMQRDRLGNEFATDQSADTSEEQGQAPEYDAIARRMDVLAALLTALRGLKARAIRKASK